MPKKINYVNSKSDHPPIIFKQISAMIENRLSKHSSNENSFNFVKKQHIDALELNGYNHELKYRKNKSKDIRKKGNVFGSTHLF